MTFRDIQLQQYYDSHLAKAGNSLGELGQVHVLIAAHVWFAMLEGAHSARVHEIIDRLLSTPMRPALRRWYGRSGVALDPTAVDFRTQLSHLTGERLDGTPEIPLNPS